MLNRRDYLSEEVEAFVRAHLEEGLAAFINEPITDATRHRIERMVADNFACLVDTGDLPPDYWRYAVKALPTDIAARTINFYMVRNFAAYPMTDREFEGAFSWGPGLYDLHRVNCTDAGTVGHYQCGWCMTHETARFVCGCYSSHRVRWNMSHGSHTRGPY